MGSQGGSGSDRDTSHRGSWFCIKGKNQWHTEAHREYGVVWSMCGLRVLRHQTDTCEELEAGQTACVRCQRQRG